MEPQLRFCLSGSRLSCDFQLGMAGTRKNVQRGGGFIEEAHLQFCFKSSLILGSPSQCIHPSCIFLPAPQKTRYFHPVGGRMRHLCWQTPLQVRIQASLANRVSKCITMSTHWIHPGPSTLDTVGYFSREVTGPNRSPHEVYHRQASPMCNVIGQPECRSSSEKTSNMKYGDQNGERRPSWNQTQWYTPVVPATQEVVTGGSLKPRNSRPEWAT
jgi:hypothetical protein